MTSNKTRDPAPGLKGSGAPGKAGGETVKGTRKMSKKYPGLSLEAEKTIEAASRGAEYDDEVMEMRCNE